VRDQRIIDKLGGVHVAFNTPFDGRGELNSAGVKKLARCYQQAGIDGLYVAGSTGEGLALHIEERKKLLEAVVEEVGDEMTVFAHIGAIATRDSVELAKHAASVPVAAISSIPRVYYRLSETEIKANWLAIIESTELPFIIYNIPSTTGYDLSYELFGEMAAVERVYGIKNTTLDASQIMKFRLLAGEQFVIFNGPDEQYLAGRIMGADGGIGGTYGSMPELFVAMERAIRNNNMEKAKEIQAAINEIIDDLYSLSSFCGAVKEIIKIRFTDIGSPRPPQASLTEQDKKTARKTAEKIEALVERFAGDV
jgi:N-acetylneuraminate lyase